MPRDPAYRAQTDAERQAARRKRVAAGVKALREAATARGQALMAITQARTLTDAHAIAWRELGRGVRAPGSTDAPSATDKA